MGGFWNISNILELTILLVLRDGGKVENAALFGTVSGLYLLIVHILMIFFKVFFRIFINASKHAPNQIADTQEALHLEENPQNESLGAEDDDNPETFIENLSTQWLLFFGSCFREYQ
ncbi:13322_t:CDS:2 [Ambispora gerdemannii]|uniref:13322_t:CDS:1 n=1 Tax=Ambispora gerdemannii TaxID=144530 RepID=A0A9N9BVG1_9GLOM|nr:13322_t:CDS:2 [Ambispora gerdemannii]